MIRSILLPTDFSRAAQASFPVAKRLARDYNATIHVVHVASPVPPYAYEEVWVDSGDRYREGLEARLRSESEHSSLSGCDVRYHLVLDEPGYRALANFAADEGMDLAVLSTHGRTGIGHVLMGSFAERFLRVAPCPVITCPPGDVAPKHVPPRTVLVPTDFSENALAAIPFVRSLKETYGTKIVFAHVLEPVHHLVDRFPSQEYIDSLHSADEKAPDHARERFESLRAREFPDLEGDFEVVAGLPHQEICEIAKARDVDNIVLATHGRTGWRHLLVGSVAERVARNATCPVISIRPAEAVEHAKEAAKAAVSSSQ